MILLHSLKGGASSPKDIASHTSQPLFRVRSGLRDLKTAGFVEETKGQYTLTKNGKVLVQ